MNNLPRMDSSHDKVIQSHVGSRCFRRLGAMFDAHDGAKIFGGTIV
jgi:hypothetical protein